MVHAPRGRKAIAARIAIESIAAGGDGVGRLDGLAVFIPRSAPGDVVVASITQQKRFARGRIDSIEQPSPARVVPLCRHYNGDDCGGCQLQHISVAAQLDAKAAIVRDTLSRIGRREVGLPDVERSPKFWDYRQKLTLTLVRNSASHEWTGGLHPLGNAEAVFALEECRISEPALVAMWHEVRAAARFLPDANELRLTLRSVAETDDVALTVAGGSDWPDRATFVRRLKNLAALWWVPDEGPRVELKAPGTDAATTAAGFVQVNASLARGMHNHVLARVQAFAPVRVIDAYAGTGALARELARQGVGVTAIEWDESAVAFMQRTLPAGSIAMASSVEGVIDEVLSGTDAFDVVVVNPPRIGLDARVTTALNAQAERALRGIVYVSCDAATLARDLSRLPAWRIQALRCFDMFPQTAHVETVCVLVPENS
ncbi:MAG: methyltransferase [Gemmatimonadota bacterium]|nr:methyltransferase [Gemmatimonadota bacterium]